MPTFVPVDHDPFAEPAASSQPRLVPVDHDPFAVSTAMDVAKSAGVGLAEGAIGAATLPGTLQGGAAKGDSAVSGWLSDKFKSSFPEAYEWLRKESAQSQQSALGKGLAEGTADTYSLRAPTPADVTQRIESVTGPFYKPQTTAGEYARTTGQFAGGAVMPGGPVQRTFNVLAPAVASETAGQLTKGTAYEAPARFAGALGGGVGASLLTRPGTASQAIKQQLPEGVTPQMVDRAEALMAEAAQRGITLAWPEALSQVAGRPILTNTMRHLEASPQTEAQMAEFFAPRPQQVEAAARSQFDNIAPVNRNPSSIGRQVGEAAEGRVNEVRKTINMAAEPFYDAAALVRISPAEMGRIRKTPGWREARDAVRNDPQLNRDVARLPDNSVGFLNEVKKYLDTAGENAAAPVNQQRNMQRSAGYGSDARVVREIAKQASPDYRTALDIERRGRAEILQPILDGPIGKIASKDTTTRQAIDAMFPRNPLPNSEREIGRAVSALAKKNPRATNDLVRAHAESTFNEAAKDLQTGANQAGGAKFRAQLIGNSQQEKNLQAAVEALPNGAQRWEGFKKFLDILEATGTRQNVGSRTAYNIEFNKNSGVGSVVSDAVKTGANPMGFFQKFVDRYERYKLGKDLGQLASVLTDPASANRLRAIARMPVESPAAQRLALAIVSANSALTTAKPNNP